MRRTKDSEGSPGKNLGRSDEQDLGRIEEQDPGMTVN